MHSICACGGAGALVGQVDPSLWRPTHCSTFLSAVVQPCEAQSVPLSDEWVCIQQSGDAYCRPPLTLPVGPSLLLLW